MNLPKKIWARDKELAGKPTGAQRRCQLEGCLGRRIGVRWPDGRITWPCSKGMLFSKTGKVATII